MRCKLILIFFMGLRKLEWSGCDEDAEATEVADINLNQEIQILIFYCIFYYHYYHNVTVH